MKISVEKLDKLLAFIDQYRGSTIFVNSYLKFPKELEQPGDDGPVIVRNGYKLIPKIQVRGVVVIGGEYPLSNEDLSIDEHLTAYSVLLLIRSKSKGVVVNNGSEGDMKVIYTYHDNAGDFDSHRLPLY